MQSLSDLPNGQLKSDIIQKMFNQMPMSQIIRFSSINRYWLSEWHFHLRSRSNPTRGVYVDEGDGELKRLFADKTKRNSDSSVGIFLLLRHFFRLLFTCKSVESVHLEIGDKSFDEEMVAAAIRMEFGGLNPAAVAKVKVGIMEIPIGLLFCLKWINCEELRFAWADRYFEWAAQSEDLQLIRGISKIVVRRGAFSLLGPSLFDAMACPTFIVEWPQLAQTEYQLYMYTASLIKDWQRNLRDIKHFQLEMVRGRKEDDEILRMVGLLYQFLEQDRQLSNPQHLQQYFIAGITAEKVVPSSSQNDETEELCVQFSQEQKDGEPFHIDIFNVLDKPKTKWS